MRSTCVLKFFSSITEDDWINLLIIDEPKHSNNPRKMGKNESKEICKNLEPTEMDIENLINKRLDLYLFCDSLYRNYFIIYCIIVLQ